MTTFETALAGPPEPKRNRWGQYMIEGKAYVRATTIADTLDDRHNLEKWQQRMVAKGISIRPDLHALASTYDIDTHRTELNQLCSKAIEAAKAVDKAGLGTALHRMTEHVDRGGDASKLPEVWQPHIHKYTSTMAEHGIAIDRTGIEQILVYGNPDDQTRIAGTADRLPVTWNGRKFCADLKTGATLEWSWRSIAIQLAIYANHNGTYNPATDTIGPRVDVDTDRALVIHLPAVQDPTQVRCDIYSIDITAGHVALLTALEVREWRATKNLAVPLTSLHVQPGERDTWFRQRGAAIAAVPAALEQLRRLWPATVPAPLPAVLSDAQAADLDTAMATVEANYGMPFPGLMPGTVTPKTKTKKAA